MYDAGITDASLKEKIRYFQDKQTGICFAERGLDESYTFTEVECTPAVLKMLPPDTIYYGDIKPTVVNNSYNAKALFFDDSNVNMDADKVAVLRWLKANDIKVEFIGDSIVLKFRK